MAVILDYKGVDICQEEITVLKDVNFSVEQNQFVFLCGKVGSGPNMTRYHLDNCKVLKLAPVTL